MESKYVQFVFNFDRGILMGKKSFVESQIYNSCIKQNCLIEAYA